MQKFTMTMSKKFDVDVPMFMGIMKSFPRQASHLKNLYSTFKSFDQTFAMFQALKSGSSIQHVGTAFTNANAMQMMVGRVGINLGKKASMFGRFAGWISKSGGNITSFIPGAGAVMNILDIVLTWIVEHPKIGHAQQAIDQLKEGIPQLEVFAEDIKPVGNRNLIRALNMAPEMVSKKTMRRLKIVLTKRNTMSAKSAAREVKLAVRAAGKVF
jgi:hypothetical protein